MNNKELTRIMQSILFVADGIALIDFGKYRLVVSCEKLNDRMSFITSLPFVKVDKVIILPEFSKRKISELARECNVKYVPHKTKVKYFTYLNQRFLDF